MCHISYIYFACYDSGCQTSTQKRVVSVCNATNVKVVGDPEHPKDIVENCQRSDSDRCDVNYETVCPECYRKEIDELTAADLPDFSEYDDIVFVSKRDVPGVMSSLWAEKLRLMQELPNPFSTERRKANQKAPKMKYWKRDPSNPERFVKRRVRKHSVLKNEIKRRDISDAPAATAAVAPAQAASDSGEDELIATGWGFPDATTTTGTPPASGGTLEGEDTGNDATGSDDDCDAFAGTKDEDLCKDYDEDTNLPDGFDALGADDFMYDDYEGPDWDNANDPATYDDRARAPSPDYGPPERTPAPPPFSTKNRESADSISDHIEDALLEDGPGLDPRKRRRPLPPLRQRLHVVILRLQNLRPRSRLYRPHRQHRRYHAP